jgi:hypothetical protein
MATINISDIRPAGYDLLLSDEGYMTDLNENELDSAVGGTGSIIASVTLGLALESQTD